MFVYEPRGFPFPFLKWKNHFLVKFWACICIYNYCKYKPKLTDCVQVAVTSVATIFFNQSFRSKELNILPHNFAFLICHLCSDQ